MGPQGIVDLADKIIFEDNSEWIGFRKYLAPLIREKDYDTFFLLYVIWINRKLEQALDNIAQEQKYGDLPENIESCVMYKMREDIKGWQKKLKEEMFIQVEKSWDMIKEVFVNDTEIPEGMKECVYKIGRGLVIASTMYEEKFERDWDLISTMLAIQYSGYAKEYIKPKFLDGYLKANEFVKKYRIYIPKFYILCWDIYKAADQREWQENQTYKHNFERTGRILAEIPEIYRNILSGKKMYPKKERVKPICTDKNGETIISIKIMVPFNQYLPGFTKERHRYRGRDNYSPSKELEKHKICHPMDQVVIPCSNLYLDTDADLYIESIYRKVEYEKIKRKIEKYEPDISILNGNKTDTALKQYQGEKIPNMNELLLKLSNMTKGVSEMLMTLEQDKDAVAAKKVRETLDTVNFSKKAYYDLFKIHKNSDYKSMPEKDTLIALAFAMKLSKEKTTELLLSAGYVLSPAIERDMIIQHFLENKMYDLKRLNDFLMAVDLKPLKGRRKK